MYREVEADVPLQPIEGESTVGFRPRGEEIDVFKFELRTRMIPEQYMQYEYNDEIPRLGISRGTSDDVGPGRFARP